MKRLNKLKVLARYDLEYAVERTIDGAKIKTRTFLSRTGRSLFITFTI